MILAIDFDGTIHDNKNPLPGRRMGLPIPGAKEALQHFLEQGHRIVIFSVWGNNPKPIEDWMQFYQIPYHEITNIKPPSLDFLIDDKAIKFKNNWEEIIHILSI
jgi:hypothetical protein